MSTSYWLWCTHTHISRLFFISSIINLHIWRVLDRGLRKVTWQ